MLGIIPGKDKTFTISDYFNDKMEEGKYYVDPKTNIIYLYSTHIKRSTPTNGYFPIYDGKNKIKSINSKIITANNIVKIDISGLIKSIDKETAERIKYDIDVKEYGEFLKPTISDEDNIFTQCR